MKTNRALVTLKAPYCIEVDGQTLLRGLDFKWLAGEHWGVVGQNGSGKSLFLSLESGRSGFDGLELEYGFAGRTGEPS